MLTLSFQSLSGSADSFQIWFDELLTEREQLDSITSQVTTLAKLCWNHSQQPCEWVDADPGVLWVDSEWKLHLFESQLFDFRTCSRFGRLSTPHLNLDLSSMQNN